MDGSQLCPHSHNKWQIRYNKPNVCSVFVSTMLAVFSSSQDWDLQPAVDKASKRFEAGSRVTESLWQNLGLR